MGIDFRDHDQREHASRIRDDGQFEVLPHELAALRKKLWKEYQAKDGDDAVS